MTVDPAQHEAHDLPLADRLIDDEIGKFISRAFATARAANPYLGISGEVYEKALDDMQHRYLSGAYYRLTPRIIGALRRAGLLVER